jgi:hypothetical protein
MRLIRSIVAALASLIFVPSLGAQESPQQGLIGKWRHTTLVRLIDGNTLAPQQFDGSMTLEFKSDNTWLLVGPDIRSAGTYRWLPSGELETTILESSLAFQVGMASVKQVRVDSERLNLSLLCKQKRSWLN